MRSTTSSRWIPLAQKTQFVQLGGDARSTDTTSDEVAEAFDWARSVTGHPQAIIARTIKGKGVSLLEAEQGGWHGKPLPPEELDKALEEIGVSA